MAPRSRTGCLTCRGRKLKCSEDRPVCAQCVKANRECIPSSGITFRHQQNPSMNGGEHGDGSLKDFYGYKETFGAGLTWVSIPKDLTFVHTSNPYEDEDGEEVGDTTMLSQQSFTDGIDASDFRLSQDAYPAYATHGLEALSAVASQDQYSYAPPAPMGQHDPMSPHTSQHPSSPQHGQATPSQNLDFILNPSSNLLSAEGNIDPRLHAPTPSSQVATAPSPTHVRIQSFAAVGGRASLRSQGSQRRPAIEDPQLAFLLRDFSERAGLWMDLFDLGLFFSARVPVLAVSCPLLLYACVSLAAKSLARVNGRKPVMGGQISTQRRSKMEFWPGAPLDGEAWVTKAREYYDVAVSLLRQTLAGASRPPTSSLPDHATPETLSQAQQAPLPSMESDELVAATAILCVYEFLDASGPEWSRHLDGAKTLFDVAKDRMTAFHLPQTPASIAQQVTQRLAVQSGIDPLLPSPHVSPGRHAVFWNFARQDMLSAFINHTSTRLDTGDIPMWLSAGIRLNADGHVCPSNPSHPEYISENSMSDDMIANTLVWLIMKLVNFIAAGDDVPGGLSPMGLGIRQQELLGYWQALEDQLLAWHDGLPNAFHATATHVHRSTAHPVREAWFARPMCASAMQSYHFAQIQLLHNKPHLTTANPAPLPTSVSPPIASGATSATSSRTPIPSMTAMSPSAPGSSLATRHASYAQILRRSRMHAREIVAIGLGRSDEGVRINSVQPLWTAGLVLGSPEPGGDNGDDDDGGGVGSVTETWRRTVVALLRGIEWDMGWASEYRVQSLLELWELPPDWPAGTRDELGI